jgi:hypothetical protein
MPDARLLLLAEGRGSVVPVGDALDASGVGDESALA